MSCVGMIIDLNVEERCKTGVSAIKVRPIDIANNLIKF